MYLYDLHKTWGHVTGVTGGWWHPSDYDLVLTSGEDGTVRIWNVTSPKKNIHVLKHKAQNGRKSGVTACAYSADAAFIVSGGEDGSVQIWDNRGNYFRPKHVVYKAHEPVSGISCTTFSSEGRLLLTRGGDATVKIWDVRKFSEPIKVLSDLENDYAQTDVVFSPNERIIATALSNKTKKGTGTVAFFDANTFEEVQRVSVTKDSAVRVLWHRDLNQIFVGCSDATVRVLYDPKLSQRGILLCVGREPRKKASD